MSLLEAVFGLAILAVLSGLAFSIFSWASTMFALSSVRLELQGEIRRINSALRRDILGILLHQRGQPSGHSHGLIAPPIPSPTVDVQRDAICFAALTDIHNPASYDKDVGLCKFDAWTVYCPYTDPSNPNLCKLFHIEYHPTLPASVNCPRQIFTEPPALFGQTRWV